MSNRFSTVLKSRTLIMLSLASALLAAAITSLVFRFAWNRGTGAAMAPAALLLALAALAAIPVVREARRGHSAPWIQLAQTAKSVALFQNYSLRARESENAELGTLVDAFNEMLGAIQRRDGDLAHRREALEDEVCARNAELRTLKEELREAQERVEATCRAQGQVLANTCHQVRTRMNGILGMTELALETPLTLSQRDYLLTAKRSAESLLTTLDGILGVPEAGLPPASAAPRDDGARPSELRVLVVEDHPVSQHLVNVFLSKHGHRARVAGNGREALEALAREEFDVILMDIQMPVMNGFEATQAIRRSERDSDVHIPIVAMTAYAMKGDRERCIECGMDAYIPKPLRPDALMETLDRVCALHAPTRRSLAG